MALRDLVAVDADPGTGGAGHDLTVRRSPGETGGGRSLMGWLRDRLARLGVRSPAGRDAVAAAVLAVLGLARASRTRSGCWW